MKHRFNRALSFLLAFVVLACCIPFGISAVAASNCTVTYDFIGDEADVAGFAQGLITITPGENSATTGYYLVYYTDGTKVLPGYDELASVAITGKPVRAEIKDGLMIPAGAKGIAVFESTTDFVDDAPDISTAVAKATIPASKQLTLSNPEFTFGLVSDVHMNYEYHDRGAYAKWTAALNFFDEQGADYVFVAGDMTGDASDSATMGTEYTLENQYKKYKELVEASPYSTDNVYECIGNHGNTNADNPLFTTYTSGAGEVHPYENSPYFHVLIEGKTSAAKDNLFIFMQQDLDDGSGGYVAGNSATRDNFTEAQIDWLEGLLTTYGNDENTNVFIFEHSPFLDYGAGDKFRGSYRALTTFSDDYPQNMRLKTLLETYKDCIVMSGHTHLTLYDNYNYSDMGNTFARTVHVGSTCWPRAYTPGTNYAPSGSDGRYTADADYGSEAYIMQVYSDYIVYTGYNMSTGKIIPAACIIIPTKANGTPAPDEAFEGSGTADDPYLIQNEGDFLVLTQGFNSSTSATETEMYGYGKYFKQTADIDMTGIESYIGTYANGNSKCYFAGSYNGNGYTITVDINAPYQRSVFPYNYGVIYNTVIKGSITADSTAQPIRTSRGKIINCLFDMTLNAETVHGVCYSNYSYIYNVYSRGVLNGTGDGTVVRNNPIASYDAAGADKGNIFHFYVDASGAEVTDTVGTRTDDLKNVVDALNIRSGEAYNDAASYTAGGMAIAEVQRNEIVFGHDGKQPESPSIPESGNIAAYGYYTLSQLYRQGGSDVDWGWDESVAITYPDETGATLTDGKFATTIGYGDEAWIGFHSKAPDYSVTGYHSITFNFDETVGIKTVNVYVGTSDVGNGVTSPDSIEVLSSDDGSTWKSVTTVNPTDVATDAASAAEKVVITVEKNTKNLQLRLKNSDWVFVSEVEIIAGEVVDHACSADGKGWYSNATTHWQACSCGEKLDEAKHTAGSWEIVKEAEIGVEGKKEKRCTVCGYLMDEEVIPALDEAPVEPEKIGLRGDVTKNGEIDSRDYVFLKRAYFGTYKLDETATLLADVNNSGGLDSRDYVFLKRAYFGTYKIPENLKYVYAE